MTYIIFHKYKINELNQVDNLINKVEMEKSQRIITQVYGYTICLVAIITFLLSTISLVNAIIDLSDPLHSSFNGGGSQNVISYENFKMDILKSSANSTDIKSNTYIPEEKMLHSMYESAKADKLKSIYHQSYKSILISSLLVLLSLVLFLIHWRIARKVNLVNSSPVF